ncbi:MAG: hypothetical protein A4E32_00585 [Methanomassiliicoccales archaeon PtaU1.Bin124]|nr:MAG: hypothetical protein A4E32_00585 [Methanomassiliicoccales archaeon PtaU1.Bin124]
MELMTVRMYQQGREIVVAACDKDQLGKVLREGELKLEVARNFYEGEDCDEVMLVNRLEMASVANLVGEKVCAVAAKHQFISEDCVIRIAGVPHAQMVRW